MRRFGWSVLLGLFLSAGVAGAEVPADEARASAASDAALITARKLRKQWDQLRDKEPTAATCVETKVAEAIAVSNRIERRRGELHEATEPKARALALSAITVLDGRRVELEDEARGCVLSKAPAIASSGMRVTMQPNPKLPPDARERELQQLLLSLPSLGR